MLTGFFLVIIFLSFTLKPCFASETEEEEEEDPELEAIMDKLSSDDPDLRSEVIDYLSYCGHPKAFELLVETLKDEDWAVRKDAVIALGNMGDIKSVPHIASLLGDEYWHVRKEVIRILGVLGGKDAVEPLMTLLRSHDELIKSSAQKALIKVGNKAIEGMLSKKISDRWMAAKTLGVLKDKRPLPLLQEAIKIERDVKVKKAIQESIDILSNLQEQQPVLPVQEEDDDTAYDPDDIIPDEPDETPAVTQPLPVQNITQPLPADNITPVQNMTQPLPAGNNQLPVQEDNQLQQTTEIASVTPKATLMTEASTAKDSELNKEVDAFLASLDENYK
ncbi:MAG: HEAT repeat domain-containing protein [Candidatus Eremiobacterota bacterium]